MINTYSRINITIPSELLSELKSLVSVGKRSKLISEALSDKLDEIKRTEAIARVAGSWNKKTSNVVFSRNSELTLWRKKIWKSFDDRLSGK